MRKNFPEARRELPSVRGEGKETIPPPVLLCADDPHDRPAHFTCSLNIFRYDHVSRFGG